MRAFSSLLVLIAVTWMPAAAPSFQKTEIPGQPPPSKTDDHAADEKVLRDSKLGVDGPALLTYFRDRTIKEHDSMRLAGLIKELGDPLFGVREKAYSELLALGNGALPAINDALAHPDPEVRLRTLELRKRIEARAEPAIQAAVARLIGLHQPENAAATLLAYLPFASDPWVAEEICKSLIKVAVRQGQAEKAVLASLTDEIAPRRGAAGAALVAAGAEQHYPAVRPLLADSQPTVRIQVALAFVRSARDKSAVPVLIDSFKTLPPEKTWQAEDLLRCLAGDDAPQVSLGSDDFSRKACFEAWDRWWKDNHVKLDLAKVDFSQALLGYTLVVFQSLPKAGVGVTYCVGEMDGAKAFRWKIDVPGLCMDAQVLGQDRVLLVERNGARVTEYDFKGNVRWQQQAAGTVLSAQRVANGNTFVVTQNGLVEYDKNGKVAYSFDRQNLIIYRGRKMRNGDVVYATLQGDVVRLDSKNNNELRSFNVGQLGTIYGNIDELPNGNLLMPLYRLKTVAEFDVNGKEVWKLVLNDAPSSAIRLPNGNTLVSFTTTRRVAEYDRNQNQVWSHGLDGPVYMARKR